MKRVHILGTSHIAKQSIDEITEYIEKNNPDIIALELDVQRAKSLLSGQMSSSASISDILRIGLKGYLFVKIGHFVQQKLGKAVGVVPGSEMKTALLLAQKKEKIAALIDQPINITLKKFSKGLTWKERFRFVSDFFRGIFFQKSMAKELGIENFDLTTVPKQELIEKMIGNIEKRYPSVYKALIDDRNKYMVRQIVKLLRKHPDMQILVVVGAGHKKGMEKLLLKVDVV